MKTGTARLPSFELDQLLLPREEVDDYVGPDNPVRFVDASLDGLDFVGAAFGRVKPKATDRLGSAPGDLLKLTPMVISTACGQAARSRCQCNIDSSGCSVH